MYNCIESIRNAVVERWDASLPVNCLLISVLGCNEAKGLVMTHYARLLSAILPGVLIWGLLSLEPARQKLAQPCDHWRQICWGRYHSSYTCICSVSVGLAISKSTNFTTNHEMTTKIGDNLTKKWQLKLGTT